MTARRLLASYVPRSRSSGALIVSAFVDSTGTGLYIAASTLFLTTVAGLSPLQVGIGLSVAGVAGFVATIPLGHLADRVGPRRLLVILQVVRGLGFVGFAFVSGPVEYVLLSVVLGASEGPISALTQSVVSSVVGEEDRVHTLALIRTARNAAFSVGTLVAAPLLFIGTDWAFRSTMLIDAASFFVGAVLLARVALRTVVRPKIKQPLSELVAGFRNGRYLSLTAINGFLMIHISVLFVALPLWAVGEGGVDPGFVPLLVIINTVVALFLQAPLSSVAERPGGGRRALGLGIAALAASALVFGFVGVGPLPVTLGVLIGGVLLLTLAEIWQSAGEWELSYRYAPDGQRSLYLSVFSTSKTIQNFAGPLIVTAAVLPLGMVGWLGLAACVLLAWPVLSVIVARLERARGEGDDVAQR